MKKTITFIIAAVMLLSLAACGRNDTADKKPGDTMSLEEIFDSILGGALDLPDLTDVTVTDENFENYLFIKPIEGAEALASEGRINVVAHSAVLLRVPEGTDAAAVAADIEANANPRKWICVEAEKTIVSTHGSTILLVMSFASTADDITSNFDSLWA